MVICLVRGADLHMFQLMPLPLTVSASVKSRLVLPFWYRLTWVVPEKWLLNGCVCVLLLNLTEKVWKSVNIWWRYGHELCVLFFLTHSVVVVARVIIDKVNCTTSYEECRSYFFLEPVGEWTIYRNLEQWDSNLSPVKLQSDTLTVRPLRPAVVVICFCPVFVCHTREHWKSVTITITQCALQLYRLVLSRTYSF